MMSSTRSCRTAAVLVIGLATTACSAVGQRQTARTFVWEGQIEAGRALEIKGVNGPIRAASGSGTSARIEAIRSGRRNDPEDVEIVVLEHTGGITVCAVYPASRGRQNECAPGDAGRIGASNNDVQVEFVVQVPASVDLIAKTTNGAVTAEGMSAGVEVHTTNGNVEIAGGSRAVARTTNGSVQLSTSGSAEARTTNGGITARLGSLDGSTPLQFSTTNGSITVALPAEADATIEASTSNGRIETDFPVSVQGRVQRNRLNGTIGSGGQLIEARTTNGRIRLEQGG